MGNLRACCEKQLGGCNSNIFGIFIPKIGEDEPILTSIFFKWVGSTTNFLAFLAHMECSSLLLRQALLLVDRTGGFENRFCPMKAVSFARAPGRSNQDHHEEISKFVWQILGKWSLIPLAPFKFGGVVSVTH